MKIKYLAILMLFLFSTVGCSTTQSKEDVTSDKVQIVTTLFPQYDFAKAIGQDKVEVMLLLPPGVEAHSYEPTPQDIVAIKEADLFIYTGEGMEPWAHKTLEGINSDKLKVVDSSKNIELLSGHEGEAFEWAGTFELKQGKYTWSFAKVDGDYADPEMLFAIIPFEDSEDSTIEATHKEGNHLFEEEPEAIKNGGAISDKEGLYKLIFDQTQDKTEFILDIQTEGTYVVLTQHFPTEFEADEHFFKDLDGTDVEALGDSHEEHAKEDEHFEDDHDHDHGAFDPHIWTDPLNAIIMVDNILETLVEVDPSNAEFYNENAKKYKEELNALHEDLLGELADLKSRTIIYGGHFAFGYFAHRYDFEHVSPYEGFSPDAEPTPQKIAEMVDLMNSLQVKTIFYEELLDPKVSRVIANETGAEMALLHGAHNVSKDELQKGVTYITIMRENLERLKVGLNGE
ncbi:MAG: hypothetical protein CVU95_08845 [Firmicutes bacterium HGW-Firmicutes-2]|jgi:zinc transport system substrate-binding protein|nr:MAG: hypothetical protein CVU95_08845 [Firmicutes bacterium HGW-Firmicutes-2]